MSALKFSGEMLRLYVLTRDGCGINRQALKRQVKAALEGGATMIQFRDKRLDGKAIRSEELLETLKGLKELTAQFGVPLVINDHVALAVAAGASGVHLGQGDGSVAEARARLGPYGIIGVTVHSVEEALQAEADGADYLGAGAVFATGSKAEVIPLGYSELSEICRSVTLPVAAIGGIQEDNLLSLSGTGISGVAVISAVFGKTVAGETAEAAEAAGVAEAARRLRMLAEKVCLADGEVTA